MNIITLFCLPFAGGNKYSYREYAKLVPRSVRIVSLEYPGRGDRIDELLMTDVGPMVEDLYSIMEADLGAGSYAIYGHSLGGLLACLLARKIHSSRKPLPRRLFITGTSGPSAASREEKQRHLLDRSGFVEEIRMMEGSPEEFLQHDELLDHFIPIMRADFKASETYQYSAAPLLPIPFTVITGDKEDMTPDDILSWQKESLYPIDFRQMPGGHFFIFDHPDKIMQVVVEQLLHLK